MMRGRNFTNLSRTILFWFLIILAANNTIAKPVGKDKPGFEFLGQTSDQGFLTLNYLLAYGGVVELRIFSAEGDLVWRNQYLNDRGENRIRLKTIAFAQGSEYAIQLNYKKESYRLAFESK